MHFVPVVRDEPSREGLRLRDEAEPYVATLFERRVPQPFDLGDGVLKISGMWNVILSLTLLHTDSRRDALLVRNRSRTTSSRRRLDAR